jgi:hypothetical protein
MATYYIDFLSGNDQNSGLSETEAKKSQESVKPVAGDTLLFKRGTSHQGRLSLVEGNENAPIRYGAYGEGSAPTFYGSVDLSSSEYWQSTERENIWLCLKSIDGDVGNFLLDGECNATLRWSEDELCSEGDFFDSRFADGEQRRRNYSEQRLLFYSKGNPARRYKSIECMPYGRRVLGVICSNIVIEDICFKNSGVHALAGAGKNVVIRRCRFENIGGCAWNSDLKIRFGNAVEFWNYAENVIVEDCVFERVYDSCVTHQGGGEELLPAMNFICRNNVFDTYGMAALELRDVVAKGFYFNGNVCKNAGCGFAMLGEELPRSSEIWPLPMGHHVFLWRMDSATDGGYVEIKNNDFGSAPVGAAIYSIISPEAERQFAIENNKFQKNDGLLIRFYGEDFTNIKDYIAKTSKDIGGIDIL